MLIPGRSSTTQPIGVKFYIQSISKSVGVFGTNSSQTDWGIGGDGPYGGQGDRIFKMQQRQVKVQAEEVGMLQMGELLFIGRKTRLKLTICNLKRNSF
jgi:hypothetical protein